ncbi:MAG: rod shape-determining protein MreC, partial [Pseudomonadota bacterium]
DYVLTGIILAVPALFLGSNLKNPGRLSSVDRVVLAVSAPLQRASYWVIAGIGDLWSRYVWLVSVEAENEELRQLNDRLRRKLATESIAAAEAQSLARLVDLRAQTPAETIGGRIVAVGMGPYLRVTRATLDRGDGEVKVGMPVISADGAVGKIRRVFGSYADILLAVDPESSIDVVVPRTGARGVLKGTGSDNSYSCRIDYLLRDAEVKEGDLVVASGLGGSFPRDTPVGKIATVSKAAYGLYQEVAVEPAVDFSNLSSVLVIMAPPPPPDPLADTKKTPKPAFEVAPYR